MSHTLYATFASPEDAERAAGALLDRGVRAEDLSLVQPDGSGLPPTAPRTTASNVASFHGSATDEAIEAPVPVPTGSVYGVTPDADVVRGTEHSATATGNAEAGAVKGTMVGAGIGTIAVIASLVIPGVGLVLGAGALASALGGILATAGAGAAAGAIVGYLKEMGVDEGVASEYGQTVERGGAVLAVSVPSGSVDEEQANAVLGEHAATNVNRYVSHSVVS